MLFLSVVKDEAGEMIREGLGKSAAVNKDFNAGDGAAAEVLTEVDGAVEKLIVEKLQDVFPDHKFIGEEGIGAETEGVGRKSQLVLLFAQATPIYFNGLFELVWSAIETKTTFIAPRIHLT